MSFINKAFRAAVMGTIGPLVQRIVGGGGDTNEYGLLTTSVTQGVDGYAQHSFTLASFSIVSLDPVDGLANPDQSLFTGTLGVSSFLMGFNGGTWDRLRSSDQMELITAPANRALTNGQITVTNASQVFSAANANRRYLLIQNNDAAGIIYISFGAPATLVNSVKILPGGYYEPLVAPNGTIEILGSIASNANCVLVEG